MKKYKIKILLILFFAIAFVFLNNNVFATTYESNVPGNSKTYDLPAIETLPSNYYDMAINYGYVIREWDNSCYLIVLGTESSYFYYKGAPSSKPTGVSGTNYHFRISNNSWVYYMESSYDFSYAVYYGADIYTDINKTALFFQLPPPIVVEEITPFQEAMKKLEMKPVLVEVVAILPVILSVLVSLIALRKGLTALFIFLHKS